MSIGCRSSIVTLTIVLMAGATHANDHIQKQKSESIEKTYLAYVNNLKAFYEKLKPAIEVNEPDLLKKLNPDPPKAVMPGYQILPKITEVPLVRAEPKDKFTTNVFSWKKTSDWVLSDQQKLNGCIKDLSATLELIKNNKALAPLTRRETLEKIIEQYQRLDKNQKVINSQIQYNRLWQGEILKYRERYDRNTKMYDDLVAGRKDPQQAVQSTLAELMAKPPSFIRYDSPKPNHNVLKIEMITDITDKKFVETFKKSVEKYWRVAHDDLLYEVKLDIVTITPEKLYQNEKPPAVGATIDVNQHVQKFAPGRGVLTTGAGTTYYSVIAGRPYVVVGVSDLTDTVLAHEFGHIMTLGDAYFRGYRDIKADGFEVLEVVPDMTDIMSAPGEGRVKKHHFDLVIQALLAQSN